MSNGHGPARWSGKKAVRAVGTHNPAAAASAAADDDNGIDATDAAKALAAENNIDLATVTGTGADGRITKDDVTTLIAGGEPAGEDPEPVEQQQLGVTADTD